MIVRSSRSTIIADTLRELVIAGKIEAGKRLTEADIAAQFHTSRTPVREAFRQLESEGLLNLRPNRGVVVTSITAEDIRNYYELHGLLVSYAAQKAATRISERVVVDMEDLTKKLRQYCKEKNYSSMVDVHNALFDRFIEVCDNQRLSSLISSLMRPYQRFRVLLSESESVDQCAEFYERIIVAFRDRDSKRAAFLAAKYSGDTSVTILRNISQVAP